MQTPVAPGWASLVVYVDVAVVVGAAVVAVVAARRRQGAPAGASLGGLAAAALPVAAAYLTGRSWSRTLAVAFNLLGIADLVVAIGTGFLASPSPFRLFFSQPSTSLMTVLPLVLIPTFLVPFWILVHAASLRALLVAGRAPEHSTAGSGNVGPASTGPFP